MHSSVYNYVEHMVALNDFNQPGFKVLEIGSRNFNGSVRPLFNKTDYIGVDMQAGEGVDYVVSSHDLMMPNSPLCERIDMGTKSAHWEWDTFDLIICLEMIEHDSAFWKTMRNIGSLLKTPGYLLISSRGATDGIEGGQNGQSMWVHGYPDDYWRPMRNGFKALFALAECDIMDLQDDTQHPGFFGLGKRREDD